MPHVNHISCVFDTVFRSQRFAIRAGMTCSTCARSNQIKTFMEVKTIKMRVIKPFGYITVTSVVPDCLWNINDDLTFALIVALLYNNSGNIQSMNI